MFHRLPLLTVFLLLATGSCIAASFNDVFSTDIGETGRKPFMWWIPGGAPHDSAAWEVHDGILQYRAENADFGPAMLNHGEPGLDLRDDSTWTLETAFRHISGTPPASQYECIVYVRWHSDTPGHIGLLSLCYDAANGELDFQNGSTAHDPLPIDMTGGFHRIRITLAEGKVCLYVDGEPRTKPEPVGSLEWEAPPQFIIGPITKTRSHTLHCQWDYFAFTEDGAFAPHDEPGWTPSADTGPVGVPTVSTAPAPVAPESCFRDSDYDGIRLLCREKGSAAYTKALPEVVHLWDRFNADKPRQVRIPFYKYPDAAESPLQNMYRGGVIPHRAGDGHCVAVFHTTRGHGDTIFGFSDYKLWYSVSTNGGHTWDPERPLIQRGAEYSEAHPVEYVWIGKNSFVFATLPAFLYPMSNGELLLPCYYLPLDGAGKPLNPFKTSTYSQVFCLIATWKEPRDDVIWDVTDPITLGTDNSPSGISECAVIELKDKPGHVLMVVRAGNEGDRTRTVPSWKWRTLSTDYGRTWSPLECFGFSDGTRFFSPTSQSNFVRSTKTQKVYWIGNISRVRPRSGWPRYPLAMAELDEKALALRKETVTILDDRTARDGSNMQLSNFDFVEDPQTQHVIIRLNRLNGAPDAVGVHTYRVEVK